MEIMTLTAAADFLSLHPDVLRKKVAAGEIPAKKIGFGKRSPWRFIRADLEKYLSKSLQEHHPGLEKHVLSLLRDLKTSDDLEKISNAIHLLGMEGIKEAVIPILEHLDSPFDEVQFVAVRALMNILGIESKKWVYPLLDKDISQNTKISIAHFFNRMERDAKSTKYLISIFKQSKDDRARHLAAYGLVESHPELVLPFIREDLESENSALRYRAVMDLFKVEYEGVENDVKKLFSDKIEKIRIKAIEAAGTKNLRSLLLDLIQIIESDSPDPTKQAAGLAIASMYGYRAHSTN